MNQKKTMNLWQMLVLVILPAILLVTMFLPAYTFDGKSFVKMYNKMSEESNDKLKDQIEDQLGGNFGYLTDQLVDVGETAMEEEMNKAIEELEKDSGVVISSITPLRIMTHSFEAFFGAEDEDDAEDEDLQALKSSYTTQRIIFWAVYILAVVITLILILGFCLKWTKYISLIISTVYGLFGTVVFGIFQFYGPSVLAKDIGAELLGMIGIPGLASTDSMPAKVMKSFWGIAFLAAFIICIFLIILSVTSMFVGNSGTEIDINGTDTSDYIYDDSGFSGGTGISGGTGTSSGAGFSNGAGTSGGAGFSSGTEISGGASFSGGAGASGGAGFSNGAGTSGRTSFEIKPQQSPMGQVKCTKGVALGQGFSLPEDRKVVVGKNSQSANMVLAHPNVSKVHCSIRYKAATNSYIVKDHSLNGTFVNGVRLQKDVAMEFPAGTVLKLADGSNEITLG